MYKHSSYDRRNCTDFDEINLKLKVISKEEMRKKLLPIKMELFEQEKEEHNWKNDYKAQCKYTEEEFEKNIVLKVVWVVKNKDLYMDLHGIKNGLKLMI